MSPAAADPVAEPVAALTLTGLVKRFGGVVAVDGIELAVPTGSFYGLVGPNGAGKTTTLSMATGLLRPDAGTASVHGVDVWTDPVAAKRMIGNLADGVRLFDRLTGEQLITYTGLLFSLPREEVAARTADLLQLMDLGSSAGVAVADYSAGMTKKVALACALVHAPRLLVLDEPFESVDPVSTAVVIEVLKRFVAAGGTVILSSHSMELTERVCDGVAIIVDGAVLAEGPLATVLDGRSLEQRFVELAGGEAAVKGMEWLQNFSD